jgi:hypothetical protein
MGSPLFATSALVGRASAGLAHAAGGRCVHDWRREKPVPEGNREMPWLRAEVHDVLLNPQVGAKPRVLFESTRVPRHATQAAQPCIARVAGCPPCVRVACASRHPKRRAGQPL